MQESLILVMLVEIGKDDREHTRDCQLGVDLWRDEPCDRAAISVFHAFLSAEAIPP